MSSSERARFPARLTALGDVAAFAQAFCERNGVQGDVASRLKLVIEELFTNTVCHGYRGESDAPVHIELDFKDGGVGVLYEDSAPRYDPIAGFSVAPPHLSASLDERPTGGLGLYIVGQLVCSVSYAYEDGLNRLWLIVPRER
jgi:serine/threonine-protein kinase RsbW